MIYECFSTLRHICTFPFSLVLTIFYFHALFIDFSHFSINQINHIIIIIVITQHLPVVPVDTPVVVWGVEWQVFVSRDRGHWPARALSCPLEEAQLTGPSGTTTLQPFIMNQDTARSPELTTIPIIAIMPRIHHPRVPDSGQSCQRTFAKFQSARRRFLLGPSFCWKPLLAPTAIALRIFANQTASWSWSLCQCLNFTST